MVRGISPLPTDLGHNKSSASKRLTHDSRQMMTQIRRFHPLLIREAANIFSKKNQLAPKINDKRVTLIIHNQSPPEAYDSPFVCGKKINKQKSSDSGDSCVVPLKIIQISRNDADVVIGFRRRMGPR